MARGIGVVVVLMLLLAPSVTAAQTPGRHPNRGRVVATICGAAGGFGLGTWIGLTKFDDAVNSDRKVWISAISGAGAGAVGGYLIGNLWDSRHSAPTPSIGTVAARPIDRRVVEQAIRSGIKLGN